MHRFLATACYRAMVLAIAGSVCQCACGQTEDATPEVMIWIEEIQEEAPEEPETLDDAIACLFDEREQAREAAIARICRLGFAARRVVPELLQALEDENDRVRWGAIRVLAMLGHPSDRAIDELTRWLDRLVTAEQDFLFVPDPATILGWLGSGASRARDSLVRALMLRAGHLPSSAAEALMRLGLRDADTCLTIMREAGRHEENRFLCDDEFSYPTSDVSCALALIFAPNMPLAVDALHADDVVLRRGALHVLAAMGPFSKDAVGESATLLEDRDRSVRMAAAVALSSIGPDAASAVPALRRMLHARDAREVVSATRALAAMGPLAVDSVPEIKEMLKLGDPMLRLEAARALGHIGPPSAPAVPLLRDILNIDLPPRRTDDYSDFSPEEELHIAAVVALGRIGPGAESAAPDLLAELDNPNRCCSDQQIVDALAGIGSGAVEELLAVLARGSYSTQTSVLVALRHLGNDALPATEVLVRYLNCDAVFRTDEVHASLVRMGSEGLPALRDTLADGPASLRGPVALVLADIGPPARALLDDLQHVVGSRDPDAANAAAVAIYRISGEVMQSLPVLVADIARERDEGTLDSEHFYAEEALRRIGPAAAPAVPHLVKACELPPPRIRRDAALALWAITHDARMAGEPLAKLIEEDWRGSTAVPLGAYALGELGPEASVFAPRVIRTILKLSPKMHEWEIERNWADLLVLFGDAAAPCVTMLSDAVACEDTRLVAIQTLGALGGVSLPAVGALRKALNGEDSRVSIAAARALARILGTEAVDALPALQYSRTVFTENWTPLMPESLAGVLGWPQEYLYYRLHDISQIGICYPIRQKLGIAGLNAPPIVKSRALEILLSSRVWDVRCAACDELAELGPAGADARLALSATLRDSDIRVREAAARALKTIQRLTNDAMFQ